MKYALVGHEARTVPEKGWASKENGDLLGLAAKHLDVFLTVDRKLPNQHDVARAGIAVVVLVAKGNRLSDLEPLMPEVLDRLRGVLPGQVIFVGA